MMRLLSRSDVSRVLSMPDCIEAVEEAFLAHAEGRTIQPGVLGTHVPGGGFHVKTAGLVTDRSWYVMKVNANFPDNPHLRGLPTVQGTLVLFDAVTGTPLAIMDSAEITRLRTAAASAVAAKHMSRPDAVVMTICGCGLQGGAHLEAIRAVRPIREVYAWDIVPENAVRLASEMARPDLRITPVETHARGTLASDIVVTCTAAKQPFLGFADLRPGTFVAAVGADSDTKQELFPDVLSRSRVVTDILEQCALIGDLHHAIHAGVMKAADVHAELADVVAGRKPGRGTDDEITVFDSTGTAIEDLAAALRAYERATEATQFDFTR